MDNSEQYVLDVSENRKSVLSATSGSQRVVFGFALIIAIGTLLLRLPVASHVPGGVSWLDAFFTATSAVTVTGLSLFSTATNYTLFGQIVILLLLQIGGIGFIALSVMLYRIAGRHVGLEDRFILQQALGINEGTNLLRLTRYVLGIVLFIELVGALCLFGRWVDTMPPAQAAYLALFHSISAFCNAGFDLFGGSEYEVLFGYGTDPWTLTVLAALISIGALGLPVMDNLIRWRPGGRLSFHTKLTLAITLILTLVGSALFLIDAQLSDGVLKEMSAKDQFWVSVFTVISTRTAGITIIPLDQIGDANKLIVTIWMFIGGAPSSMAGGVTTSTVVVLALAMRATVKGEQQAVAFGRAMPHETIFKAIAVMTVSTLLVAIITILMTFFSDGDLFYVIFEVISAFSNTGYSLGLTGDLSTTGKLLIIFLMFWGRLGPLTLVVVLAQRQHPSLVTYPEEKLIMG
ncbi:MAG: TrkH family potassium uptake protein [Ardenticatenaceae bacterium]